eukprot:TRINITY_DN13006_c0_g1_i1.p1 TRINITY_DN13006_c0_g1~~TRINITY_DN13006_c0_g1_i1.p1  ORF type:complete len:375 (+),score=89.60 TRINITY_DN13006_c0_g1_i1:87-1127(+)
MAQQPTHSPQHLHLLVDEAFAVHIPQLRRPRDGDLLTEWELCHNAEVAVELVAEACQSYGVDPTGICPRRVAAGDRRQLNALCALLLWLRALRVQFGVRSPTLRPAAPLSPRTSSSPTPSSSETSSGSVPLLPPVSPICSSAKGPPMRSSLGDPSVDTAPLAAAQLSPSTPAAPAVGSGAAASAAGAVLLVLAAAAGDGPPHQPAARTHTVLSGRSGGAFAASPAGCMRTSMRAYARNSAAALRTERARVVSAHQEERRRVLAALLRRQHAAELEQRRAAKETQRLRREVAAEARARWREALVRGRGVREWRLCSVEALLAATDRSGLAAGQWRNAPAPRELCCTL